MASPARLMSCDFSGSGFGPITMIPMACRVIPVPVLLPLPPTPLTRFVPAGGNSNVHQQPQVPKPVPLPDCIEDCLSPDSSPKHRQVDFDAVVIQQPTAPEVRVYERTSCHDNAARLLATVRVPGAESMTQAEFVLIVKAELRRQDVILDDDNAELNVYLLTKKKDTCTQPWEYLPHNGLEHRVVTDPETGSKKKFKVAYRLGDRRRDRGAMDPITLAVQLVRCGNNQQPCVHWSMNTCHQPLTCNYCHDTCGSTASESLPKFSPPEPDSA